MLRFLFSCVVLCAFIWFSVSVPLGKYTLWGHLVRISRTSEAKDLAAGAKDTAKDVARKVQKELEPGADEKGKPTPPESAGKGKPAPSPH